MEPLGLGEVEGGPREAGVGEQDADVAAARTSGRHGSGKSVSFLDSSFRLGRLRGDRCRHCGQPGIVGGKRKRRVKSSKLCAEPACLWHRQIDSANMLSIEPREQAVAVATDLGDHFA